MKEILRKIHLKSVIFINSITSILSIFIFSSFKLNNHIKNQASTPKKSQEIFILGNGPSLNSFLEKNLNKINEKDVLVVNYFALTSYFEFLKPSFYLMLDEDIYNFNPLIYNDYNKKNYELTSTFNKVSWNMTLFVPLKFKKSKLINLIKNENINIIFFNSTPVKGHRMVENFLYKTNLGMPKPETVTIPAIFLAINLKYTILNLHGVESSWLKDLKITHDNEVIVNLPHFYKGSESIAGHSTLKTLSAFLITQANCFSSHMRLQEYSIYNSCEIYNYTPESYIDAYKKVNLEEK